MVPIFIKNHNRNKRNAERLTLNATVNRQLPTAICHLPTKIKPTFQQNSFMRKIKFITAFLIFCMAGMPFISKAQLRPITGTILDSKNRPIAGASILIQGKSQGTVSDDTGKFKLNLADNSSLIITYTGYRS